MHHQHQAVPNLPAVTNIYLGKLYKSLPIHREALLFLIYEATAYWYI